jgi:hypothetical protein
MGPIAKSTLALAAYLIQLTAATQVICTMGTSASSYKASEDQRPSPDATELVSRAFTAARNVCGSHCPEVVLFRNATAPNLMLIHEGQRAKLVYAPQFIAAVYDRYGDAGITALAEHTIGHALDDTLGAAWIEKSWTPELRADSWAGCVLANSNLSPGDLKSSLAALENYPPSSHPAWNLRLPPIRAGYTHCGGKAFPA